MFIQTEDTPNPDSLKFLPGRIISEKGTLEFTSLEEAHSSRLARQLLAVSGIKSIFFGYDFITVTKSSESDWGLLKPHILTSIMDHLTSGLPIFEVQHDAASSEDADPLSRQIRELIETRVRPAVAMDGGDITFDHFEDGIVYLHLRGACSGCPSSSATLKSGIENMLRHYVPEVLEVRAINESA